MENRNRQDFKGATAKKNLSEGSDAEMQAFQNFSIRDLEICATGFLLIIVKSQNTRLTLRTAWHLPAGSGLVQPSPRGQHGTLILTALLSAAHGQLHCAELHCQGSVCSWLIPPAGCPWLTNVVLAWLKRTPLMHSSSLTCFCSPFCRCCMQNFAYIYACEAEADYLFGSCERIFFFFLLSDLRQAQLK